MSGLDWQTPLSAAASGLAASIAFLAVGLYQVLAWAAVHIPIYVYTALSYLVAPLTYPVWFLVRVVAFVFSPVWAVMRVFTGVVSWVLGVVVKFKYLYIYFAVAAAIGLLTACTLYGTSNKVFLILGIAGSDQRRKEQRASSRSPRRLLSYGTAPEATSDTMSRAEIGQDEEDDSSGSPTDFNSILQKARSKDGGAGPPMRMSATCEQAYRRAKSTQLSPIGSSRRFRGLLSQTIREESSESDS